MIFSSIFSQHGSIGSNGSINIEIKEKIPIGTCVLKDFSVASSQFGSKLTVFGVVTQSGLVTVRGYWENKKFRGLPNGEKIFLNDNGSISENAGTFEREIGFKINEGIFIDPASYNTGGPITAYLDDTIESVNDFDTIFVAMKDGIIAETIYTASPTTNVIYVAELI